jgi:hypothetical protein
MTSPWTYQIDGADIVVRNITASCFGGAYDSGDDGRTESGLLNDGSDPGLMGVALPVRSIEPATRASPLAFPGPHIPWFTQVNIWREAGGEQTAIECLLIDNGPDQLRCPTHAIDLNPNVVLKFSPGFDPRRVADDWLQPGFSFRVVGAAKYAFCDKNFTFATGHT